MTWIAVVIIIAACILKDGGGPRSGGHRPIPRVGPMPAPPAGGSGVLQPPLGTPVAIVVSDA